MWTLTQPHLMFETPSAASRTVFRRMLLAVTSDTMSVQDLSGFVEDEIVDRLSSVPGVATVQTYGDRDKIFRVDIDPARLASLGMTIGDIGTALSSVAFDSPAGSITNSTQD